MNVSAITALSVAMLALAGMSSDASAKDWIKTMTLSKGGIDAVPIEVRANSSGYTSVKTANHRFLLRGTISAKSGKRVAGGYFSRDANKFKKAWSYKIPFRDYGSGTKKDVTINIRPTISLNKLDWAVDPVRACRLKMATLAKQGMSNHAILSHNQTATARAKFYLKAYAARPKTAKKQKFLTSGNYTTETKGLYYDVRVRCLGATNSNS